MKRLITALFILFVTALSTSAAEKENILNAIQIDSLKDTYNITLSTLSETDVKRTIQSSDNMILTLKNIKPAKSMNTIYKSAAEIDSIMVEPVGENNLNIIVKAKNISNAAVIVEPEEVATVSDKSVITPKKHKKSKKESIVLAAPVGAYAPVYKDEENIDDIEEENTFVTALLAKVKEILSQGNTSNIITTGLIGLILFCGIKLFKKEEPETVVGLAQSLKERENALYKDMSMYNNTRLQLPQTPNTFSMPKETSVNKPVNLNSGYGLRAYKSSTKSPYMSADNTMMQKQTSSMQAAPQKTTPKPRMVATAGSRLGNVSAPQGLGGSNLVHNLSRTQTTASNIDSMRFLESMTKIYEKNGRSDLAQGLKAGMLKAKSNI